MSWLVRVACSLRATTISPHLTPEHLAGGWRGDCDRLVEVVEGEVGGNGLSLDREFLRHFHRAALLVDPHVDRDLRESRRCEGLFDGRGGGSGVPLGVLCVW